MKPLQLVALGLVITLIDAPPAGAGYDLIADPVGWILVLVGVRRLPKDLPHRGALFWLGVAAGLVSLLMYVPVVADAAYRDPALGWGMSVLQLVFSVLLPWVLATRAAEADEDDARKWLRMAAVLGILVLVLPPVVLGGGLDVLGPGVSVLVLVTTVLLVILLFAYHDRSWAGGTGGSDPQRTGSPGRHP